MALRAGYYGLKKKLLEKVNFLPGIKSIGDGLSLNDTTGVLSAIGGGADKADKTDIAPVETGTTASRAYAVGQQFYLSDGKLYKAKEDIAQGATFTVGTNCALADCITEQIKASLFPLISEMTAPTISDNRVKDVVGGYKQIGKTVYVDVCFTLNVVQTFSVYTYPKLSNMGIFTGLPTEKYFTGLLCTYLDASGHFCDLLMSVKNGSMTLSGSNNFSTSTSDIVHVRGTYEVN